MCRTLDYCRECGMSLSLLGRSEEAPNTCPDCAAKLRVSFFGECEECNRVIEVGEKIHLQWKKLCGYCAKREEKIFDLSLPTNTVAFAR